MNPGNGEFLSHELAPILCRLPVKSVVRFRSLSTDLRWLIDSPGFIHVYFQSSQSRCRIFLLLFRRHTTALPHGSCRLPCPQQHPRWISTNLGPVATATWNANAALIGSYRGVVCIAFSPFNLCLWNPSTRTHKHLPFHPYANNRTFCRRVRFGFGPCADQEGDYMVIRIVISYSPRIQQLFWEFSAYRLSSNTWEYLNENPLTCFYFMDNNLWERRQTGWEFGEAGVYSNGAVHWLGLNLMNYPIPYEIIKYKLGMPITVYKQNIPSSILGERSYESILSTSLSSIDETFFLTCRYRDESNEAEIWKRQNYLDETSWCKILVVHGYFERLKPVLVSGDGKRILLRMDSRLVWYNLESGRRMEEWDTLTLDGSDLLSDATDLFECLEPVPGGQGNCEEP